MGNTTAQVKFVGIANDKRVAVEITRYNPHTEDTIRDKQIFGPAPDAVDQGVTWAIEVLMTRHHMRYMGARNAVLVAATHHTEDVAVAS